MSEMVVAVLIAGPFMALFVTLLLAKFVKNDKIQSWILYPTWTIACIGLIVVIGHFVLLVKGI